MTTLQPSLLLRRALLADGLVGVITAAQLLLLADWLSGLLALPLAEPRRPALKRA